jgi:hypothetical protein
MASVRTPIRFVPTCARKTNVPLCFAMARAERPSGHLLEIQHLSQLAVHARDSDEWDLIVSRRYLRPVWILFKKKLYFCVFDVSFLEMKRSSIAHLLCART